MIRFGNAVVAVGILLAINASSCLATDSQAPEILQRLRSQMRSLEQYQIRYTVTKSINGKKAPFVLYGHLLRSGQSVRYDERIVGDKSRESTKAQVCDGTQVTSLFNEQGSKAVTADIGLGRRLELRDDPLAAAGFGIASADAEKTDKDRIFRETKAEELDGEMVVRVCFISAYLPGVNAETSIFIKESGGWLYLLKVLSVTDGKDRPVIHSNVLEYSKSDESYPFPIKVTNVSADPVEKREPQETTTTEISSFTRSPEFKPEIFSVAFPNGTAVNDRVRRASFIVGNARFFNDRVSRLAELDRADSVVSKGKPSRDDGVESAPASPAPKRSGVVPLVGWILVLVSVCIFAGAAVFWWKQKARQ